VNLERATVEREIAMLKTIGDAWFSEYASQRRQARANS